MKIKFAVYSIVVIVMLYQVTTVLIQYITSPTSTTMYWERTRRLNVSETLVCVKGWQNILKDDTDKTNWTNQFQIGFSENAKAFFSKKTEATEAEITDLIGAAKVSYLESEGAYWDHLRSFYRIKSADTRMVPVYQDAEIACAYQSLNKPGRRRLTAKASVDYAFSDTYLPPISESGKVSVYVSLNLYKNFDALDFEDDFLRFDVEPAKEMTIKLKFKHPKLKIAVPNKQNPCVRSSVVYRLPLLHTMRDCKKNCKVEVEKMYHNCTPIAAWFADMDKKQLNQSRTICHHLLKLKEDRTLRDRFEECMADRKCEDLVPCRSWEFEIKAEGAEFNGKVENIKKDKDMKIRVYINLPPVVDIVEQYNSVTFEAVVGTVGGIMGVWCGLSVIGVMSMISTAYAAVQARRTEPRDAREKDEKKQEPRNT